MNRRERGRVEDHRQNDLKELRGGYGQNALSRLAWRLKCDEEAMWFGLDSLVQVCRCSSGGCR